jgi:hypothetical protein
VKRIKIEIVVMIDDKEAKVETVNVTEPLERGARLKIQEIEIKRIEGPPEQCERAFVTNTFSEADGILRRMAESSPDRGGTDRVDFRLKFEDGEVYNGRYNLKNDDKLKSEILALHVREFVRFHAGMDTERFTDDVQRYFIEAKIDPEKFRYFYQRYDIGQGSGDAE